MLVSLRPTRADAQQPGDPFARLQRPDDVVMLKDGTVYRGRLLERVPGDHTTLLLEGGEAVRFSWRALQQPPRAATSSDSHGGLVAGLTVSGVAVAGAGALLAASALQRMMNPRLRRSSTSVFRLPQPSLLPIVHARV